MNTPAVTGRILTGVTSHFSAAHYAPPLPGSKAQRGEMHGHTWQVTAWFENEGKADARLFKCALEQVLKLWDHKVLPDELAWGEDIARAVGTLNNCVQVDVSRPMEGFHARWINTVSVSPEQSKREKL
jgi:6-pyruvoyl-tetrahydropterin synthase